jgi:diguanylate cyclase (GGDEF)-like protein/PAS domain S-box-containing protein
MKVERHPASHHEMERQGPGSMALAETIVTADAPPADLYRIIAENVCDGVLFVGLGETCQYASPSVQEIIGRAPAAMLGISILDLVHPDDRALVERHYDELMRGERDRFIVEFRAAHDNGRWIWLEASARAVVEATGRSAVTSVRDIRWRKQLEEQLLEALNEAEEKADELQRLATTDVLTGLANRRRFMDELGRAVVGTVALAVCDIDHFKRINDVHGHLAGDEALRWFAAVAQRSFADGLVGRIGGEEFGILLPGAGLDVAVARCESFLVELAREDWALPTGEHVGLTASIGVAVTPCTDASDLMLRADRLLYAAKRAGRNRVMSEAGARRAA